MADKTSTTGGRCDASDGSVFAQCQRWRTHLRHRSAAYRALEEERERGWKSAALDAWYKGHRADQRPELQQTVHSSNPEAHPARGEEAGRTHPSPASLPSSPVTTSFVDADATVLAERYRQHCRGILTAAAPDFFVPVAALAEQAPSPRPPLVRAPSGSPSLFMDMGCAPGGVSKYLVQDLGWGGVGITLPDAAGGIRVDATLTGSAGDSTDEQRLFTLWEGDVTQPARTWRRVTPSAPAADAAAAMTEDVGTWDTNRRFRFVNGGAVQDHGQRLLQQQQMQRGTDGEDDGAILPWFNLFAPQLRAALAHVQEGGAMMLVYGAPHCASLMILLEALTPLLAPAEPVEGDGPASSIAILETMHVMKPPVYVLFRGVHTVGHAQRITRLLASLDASSDVLSPVETGDKASGLTLAGMTPEQRRRQKQLFWLGESDEGFALAEAGLARYGDRVGHVWERARQCLWSRRRRAERAIEGHSGSVPSPQRLTGAPQRGTRSFLPRADGISGTKRPRP